MKRRLPPVWVRLAAMLLILSLPLGCTKRQVPAGSGSWQSLKLARRGAALGGGAAVRKAAVTGDDAAGEVVGFGELQFWDMGRASPGAYNWTSPKILNDAAAGQPAVVISNISLVGDPAFSLDLGDCGPLPKSLLPGAVCGFMIFFKPTAVPFSPNSKIFPTVHTSGLIQFESDPPLTFANIVGTVVDSPDKILWGCTISQAICAAHPEFAGTHYAKDFPDGQAFANDDYTKLTNSALCLSLAKHYAAWCANGVDTTTTAVYQLMDGTSGDPDSATASGIGCTITQPECTKDPKYIGTFPDVTNGAGLSADACLPRADAWAQYCGNREAVETLATYLDAAGTLSRKLVNGPVAPPSPTPVPTVSASPTLHWVSGPFIVGSTTYWSNGSTAYCSFVSSEHFLKYLNRTDFNGVPTYATLPTEEVYNDTCKYTYPGGFFLVGGATIFYSNGNDAICAFNDWQKYLNAGGPDTSTLPKYSALLPTNMRNDGICAMGAAPSVPTATAVVPNGPFTVGSTTYWSNGSTAYCSFVSSDHFLKYLNRTDFNGVPTYPALPTAEVYNDTCKYTYPGGFFLVGGATIFFSNGNDAICAFNDWQKYLNAGGPDTSTLPKYSTLLPTNMRNDGICR